jgi:FOG: Ankyrin repeat
MKINNTIIVMPAVIAAFALASCASKPCLQEVANAPPHDGISVAETNECEKQVEAFVEQPGEEEFWRALQKSDMETVKRLIAEGYDIRKNRRSSIIWQLMANRHAYKPTLEIIKFFMDAGEDIDELDGYNRSGALAEAIAGNDFNIARFALENGANPNWRDTLYEGNALHYAAENAKDIRIFEALLEHGADINLRDNNGRTPIMYALSPDAFYYEENVRAPDHEVLSLLIRSGADLLAASNYGHDTLMSALVEETNSETIHFIWNALAAQRPECLQNPAYLAQLVVRTRDDEFLATLAAAVSRFPIEPSPRYDHESDKAHLLRQLFSAGVKADSRDARGRTLLTNASTCMDTVKPPFDGMKSDPWREYNLGKPDTAALRALVSAGADINARDNHGWTPLLAASHHAVPEVIEFLLDNGADINAKSDNGCNALHCAAEYNLDFQVALKLLRAGADINAVNETGETPLICAAENYRKMSYDLAWLLFKLGADIHARDKHGRTILKQLVHRNTSHLDFFRALLDAGADQNLTPEERTEIVRHAYSQGIDEARIIKLLHRGIDFKQGEILQCAIEKSSPATIEFLMEKSPALDLKYGRWDATLINALNKGDMRIVDFLLKSGVKIPPRNQFYSDRPLLTLVRTDGALPPTLLARFHETDPYWLKDTDNDNKTLLMFAAENQSDPQTIITLLELGADPNARTRSEGRTALAYLRDNPKLRHTPAFDALLNAIK